MKKPFMIFLTAFAASFALCAASSSTTFNVRDFGAKGDGKTDDTAAVQRALNKLNEERVKQKMILGNMGGLPCGVWHGPCGELYFPRGIYRITSTLVGEAGLKITGEDGSILDASGLKAPTLYLHKAFNVTVENMTFHGGETQILFWTANQDSAAIVIRASTFRASTGHAVVSASYADADTSDPAKWNRIRPVAPYEISWSNGMPKLKKRNPARTWANSTRMVIRNCRFENCAGIYRGHGDAQIFADCTAYADKMSSESLIDASGSLFLRNLKAEIPVGVRPWIAFRNGRIMARNLTFLSRNGNGAPLAVCKKSYPRADARYGEYVNMVFEDCTVSASNGRDDALLMIADCPPSQMTFRRCREARGRNVRAVRFRKRVIPEKTLILPRPAVENAMGFVFEDNHESIDETLPREVELFLRKPAPSSVRISDPVLPGPEGRSVFLAETVAALKEILQKCADVEKPLIMLAGKKFILHDALVLPPSAMLIGCGTPVLIQKKANAPVFRAEGGLNLVISGITASGGLRTGEFRGTGNIFLDNCMFYDNRGILADSPDAAHPLRLTIRDSTLSTIRGIINNGGIAELHDSWCSPRPVLNDAGFFVNNGTLILRNMIGIPILLHGTPGFEKWKYGNNLCWTENSGTLLSRDCRYGGEGGGIPAVRNHRGTLFLEGAYAYFFHPSSSGSLIENESSAAEILVRDLSSYPGMGKKKMLLKGIRPARLEVSNVLYGEWGINENSSCFSPRRPRFNCGTQKKATFPHFFGNIALEELSLKKSCIQTTTPKKESNS